VYCLPEAGVQWQPWEDQLSAEEIGCIADAAAQGGVKRIRLTGGEPLVRRDIFEIVARLASIPGIEEVSLTTNAMLLERWAQPLAGAGLKRVNVSLDTLDADKFMRITRGGNIDRFWRGITATENAGLAPLKLNTVVVNGLNADELPALARLTIEHSWHIRFIELMPVGNAQNWGEGFPVLDDRYLSVQEMQSRLSTLNLQPATASIGNGPARTFRIPGALGTVGFISPLGEHFCQNCNRLRLTADGHLRPCLLLDGEVNIRDAVRSGKPLLPLLQQAVDAKPQGHELFLQHYPESRRMAQIGG
jgi:cyclic pyranopterin phosphate synthase